jgi:hypothetical protein
MPSDFPSIFAALKPVLSSAAPRLLVKTDTGTEYTVVTKGASPFPQHKGEPLHFGSVRLGKAYVSYHLMPLYMCPALNESISPQLKKRMQGKTCFNFRTGPEPELLTELERLTAAGLEQWRERKWA